MNKKERKQSREAIRRKLEINGVIQEMARRLYRSADEGAFDQKEFDRLHKKVCDLTEESLHHTESIHSAIKHRDAQDKRLRSLEASKSGLAIALILVAVTSFLLHVHTLAKQSTDEPTPERVRVIENAASD